MPEPVPAELQLALRATAASRGRYGQPVYFLSETRSTNDAAAALAERGAPEGTMVIAGAQTAGRGRQGRLWFSPPGAGLYVSIVLRDARAAPLVTLAAGVAIADGVRAATGLPALIKWPNDVVVADAAAPGGVRKLAGVLAEGSTAAGVLQHVILGFGVNLRSAAYPPELASRATSLEAELGRAVDAGAVLAAILVAMNGALGAARAEEPRPLLDRLRELAPSAIGRRVSWGAGRAACRGTTAGIDERGALLVTTDAGTERILSGEVIWL